MLCYVLSLLSWFKHLLECRDSIRSGGLVEAPHVLVHLRKALFHIILSTAFSNCAEAKPQRRVMELEKNNEKWTDCVKKVWKLNPIISKNITKMDRGSIVFLTCACTIVKKLFLMTFTIMLKVSRSLILRDTHLDILQHSFSQSTKKICVYCSNVLLMKTFSWFHQQC